MTNTKIVSANLTRQTDCSISGCERRRVAKNLCHLHYERQLKHGSPFITLRPGNAGSGRKPIERPGYSGMHERVRTAYGNPGNWLCIDCDQRALDWSLSSMAVDVVTEVVGGREKTYSYRVQDYDPRCRSHHRTLDQAIRRDRA